MSKTALLATLRLCLILGSLLAVGSVALSQAAKPPLKKEEILSMLKAESARVPQGEIG
jgi:hypothetical protein